MSSSSVLDLHKKWFMVPLPLRTCSLRDVATFTVTKEQMDKYYQEAQSILDDEGKAAQMDRGRWYSSQFMSRGTTSDKIATAAVKLADTDFMFYLDGFTLLFDTARTDTHHYEAALKALTAVWPRLLPPRPLKRFVSQYFATLPTDDVARKTTLVYWYLEDYLKRTYAQFLALSESMLKDRIVQRRDTWLDAVGKLLCSVAEGRSTAMAMMIDKLGDPVSSVAHKAYHHLLKLLSESSTHQSMLFTELEKVIFMKNCPLRTMRYAANVMNQLVFSKEERKLALKCVQTYLSLFRQLALTGNVDSTVTTAIIVGLRRAFPYAGVDLAPLEEHLNALFILANTGNFQQRVATLTLLQLLAFNKGTAESFLNRWYRTLYGLLLLSPKQIPQSAQLTNFFSLLHKAMRADKSKARIAAFVHRLLQRAVFFNDAMICAVLLLVGEMSQAHPHVRKMLKAHANPLAAPAALAQKGKAGNGTGTASAASSGCNYDPKAREPLFANAAGECIWTLNMLSRHSHPSVVKLSILLLFGEDIVFDVHPLDDMTPLNFLNMFVDARANSKDDDDAKAGNTATGISVFHRAAHKASLPSTSDPYFINASAQDVDVAALFLHRYAVQRQRFLEGLSQVRSTWGDTSGEADVAMRVTNLDAALFGPSGTLADPVGTANAAAASRGTKKATAAPKRAAAKDKDEEVSDEGERDGQGSTDGLAGDGDDASGDDLDDFDAEASDNGLEWGLDDEAACDAELDDEEVEEDDDEDAEDALGGSAAAAAAMADEGAEFGELIEANAKEMSKKRKRELDWLEGRSAGGSGGRSGFGRGRGGAGRTRGASPYGRGRLRGRVSSRVQGGGGFKRGRY
ncbi:CBF/Mak21 family, putative [Leishmania donovani]|uniref:CBF/Mak21 family, putative n=1 Tax=Leishmania donovani TaxID=5661 RepID=A0A3S7X0Q5_LEIDO|nr:CBF/Mak21 family, putative [Leishmania donovani]